jgi:hypothetical protein
MIRLYDIVDSHAQRSLGLVEESRVEYEHIRDAKYNARPAFARLQTHGR